MSFNLRSPFICRQDTAMRAALLFLFIALAWTVSAQEIIVKGKVLPPKGETGLVYFMVINKTSGFGKFGERDGSFSIKVNRADTILVASTGLKTKSLCFKDSTPKSFFKVVIQMEKLLVELKPVEIFPKRDLDRIYEDVSKLGYRKKDYVLSGIDAASSPITFLYQSFSHREREKRELARTINEDNLRRLLKELLGTYVDGELISLRNEEFDEFIDYCKVSEAFLKNSTQYDFIVFIKKKYKEYTEYRW